MILYLMGWLESLGYKVPLVFGYYSTRMILASVTSLLLCIFWGPFFIRKLYEKKIGQPIRKEDCPLLGELHKKKQDTPTMGGILILLAALSSLVLWMDLSHLVTWLLLLTTLVLGWLGGYDDYLKLRFKNSKGLSGRKKMAIQLSFSFLVIAFLLSPWAQGEEKLFGLLTLPYAKDMGTPEQILPVGEYVCRLYLPFFKDPVVIFSGLGLLIFVPFLMCVMTGTSNAVNLADGLDGLAAGLLVLSCGAFALIAFVSNNIELAGYLKILYIEGSGEVAIYLAAICGACLGFLWYNGAPAQVFMGDTGSLSLGGILGICAVLLKRELLLVLVGGIFVAEAMSVILQVLSYRYRNKKRVFLIAPLHHHFEYKGWAETKVVIRFWIVGLILALLGIATLKFQ